MVYMFLSNNPSSGDINLSNLPCSFLYFVGSDLHKNYKWYQQETSLVDRSC